MCGLLLVSLSIGVALSVARQEADAKLHFDSSRLQAQLSGLQSAAGALASDLGLNTSETLKISWGEC